MVTEAKSNQTKISQAMMNSQTTMGSQMTVQMMESYRTTMMSSHTMMKFQMMLSSYQMMGITKKTSPSGGMRRSTTISKTITIIGKIYPTMRTSTLILSKKISL